MTFGQRVKAIKKLHRLSEKELEIICGVSSTSLTAYYNEKSEPKLSVVSKILERFPDINTRWLLTGLGNIEMNNTSSSGNIIKGKKNKLAGGDINQVNEDSGKYMSRIEALENENSRLKDELLKAKDDLIEALRKK